MPYTLETRSEIIKLKKQGLSGRKIAKLLSLGKSGVNGFLARLPNEITQENEREVKTLLLDIENSPIMGAVWRLWKQNVGLNQIHKDWFVMSFAAKWLHSDEVIYQDNRDDFEHDLPLLETLWELFNEADVVVCHNVAHDIPKIKARMVLHGMRPPSPFKTYCTLQAAKKIFGFTSNKLEYLSNMLSDRPKTLHPNFPGYELWSECLKGNPLAWDEMKVYNINDVPSLEDVYLTLRVWDSYHPNVNVYSEDETARCTVCGSSHLTHSGYSHTNFGLYNRYVCNDCGKWSRSRYTLNSNNKRKSLLA